MFSTHDGVREAILGKAYPELLYGSDPDIERYFELRSQGRSDEALRVYHFRLRAKYPDEGRRVLLLSHFRTKDPRYGSLLRQSALELAASMIERIKRNIRYLTLPMEGVPERDPYRLIKAVEQVARFLPSDRFEAVAFLDSYRRYAELLDFKRELMSFTADLGKEYLLESQAEGDDDHVDFMERSRQLERQKREKGAKRHFDLSRIRFDPTDIARIVLPPHVARKEDKVVGYCYKYWDLVNDPGFERVVLLYSRKFHTFHYDVYRTIKIGRMRKFTDDEILNRVSTALSSSYSYSVQGDIYMLAMWRRVRSGLTPAIMAVAAPAEEAAPQRRSAKPKASRTSDTSRTADIAAEPSPKAMQPERPAAPSFMEARKQGTEKSTDAEIVEATAPRRDAPVLKAGAAFKTVKAFTPPAKPAKGKPRAAAARLIATGSVSEIVRRISGRSYDVYHDIFLASVRASIRSALSANQSRSHGLFDASLNAAEEAVHAFIKANYENPYMDWAGSKERAKVEGLGYALPSLLPVIEDCVRKL